MKRRCHTCKHWERLRNGHPDADAELTMGECHAPVPPWAQDPGDYQPVEHDDEQAQDCACFVHRKDGVCPECGGEA